MDRLEEIRKRDELYNGQFTTIVYSDRRWLLGEVDAQREELERLREALDNRAGELLRKNKFFLVVAHDEPYFMNVYAKIRHREIDIGRWSDEDEELYNEWYNRALARQSELAGEFTGKIETVKLYPKALTPEETSNDYEEARTAARMAYYELTEKLDGEE